MFVMPILGTGNVIQTCLECNVERLVFCSSVDVVIGHKEIDHGNETLRIPKKFLFPGYPKTKFKAERLVRMASGETCKNGLSSYVTNYQRSSVNGKDFFSSEKPS